MFNQFSKELNYITKLPTDIITKLKMIDDTLYAFSEDGVMYKFLISDFIFGFYKKEIGYISDILSDEENSFIATVNGVYRLDGNELTSIQSTHGRTVTSIAFSFDKKKLHYAIGHTIYTYDIALQNVISESSNPSLSSSSDTAQFQLYQGNQILNLTPTPYGEIFYESYNDGLWLLDKEGEHKFHSSNEELNHVRYTNSFAYIDNKLAIVRLSDSFAVVDRNKSDVLLMSPANGFDKRLSHKYTYEINGEFFAAHGDGTFTKLNGNLAKTKILNSGLSGGACLAKINDKEFLTVDNNIIYSWTDGGGVKEIRDLSRFVGGTISLSSFKCRLNDNILTLANNNYLFVINLNLPSPMEQLVSAPIISFRVLDQNYNLIESFPKLENNVFSTDNPNAKYLSIEYGSVNQEVSLSFRMNDSDLIKTAGVIQVPINSGDKNYLISGYIGKDKLFEQNIRIIKNYTLFSFFEIYAVQLLILAFVLIAAIVVWLSSVKSERYIRSKLSLFQFLLDACLSRMQQVVVEANTSINDARDKHVINNKYASDIDGSLAHLEKDMSYMRAIIENKDENNSESTVSLSEVLEKLEAKFDFLNTKIALAERSSIWLTIDKLLFSYLIDNYCNLSEKTSVELAGDSVVIKLQLKLEDRAIVKSFLKKLNNSRTNSRIRNNSLIINCKLERSNNFGLLKSDKPYVRTSEKKLNIVFVGELSEFDTEIKRKRLQELMKQKLVSCRCVFVSTSRALVDFYNEYPVSYIFYVNIYSNQTTFINRAINERVDEINVLCNRSVQVSLTGLSNVNPINIDLADKILVKIFQKANVRLLNKKPSSMEKLEHQIDRFISHQKDVGPDLAKPFPTGFNAFMKLQNFSLSAYEIAEIQDVVGESINDYCKRLRGRLLAGYIRENPNCSISSAKLYHGFSEKSRTIAIFKAEYGVTPEQYKKSLRRNRAVS